MKERLGETLYFFRSHLGVLLLVTLPFAAAAAFAVHLWREPVAMADADAQPELHWQSALALILLQPLSLAAKVLGIHQVVQDGRLAPGLLLRDALGRFGTLFLLGFTVGVPVLLGLYFLIIPGVYVYARLGYAPLLVLLEGRGALEATAASWRLTRDDQGELFALTLLLGGVAVGGMLLVFQLVAGAGAQDALGGDLAARVVGELLFCLPTIAFYRYWTLRRGTPGMGSEPP